MENISDIMGFGPYAENNEGQPKLDNGPKKPIGMEEVLKNYKPDSVDIMDPDFKFRPMFMNDTDVQGRSPNSADDKYCRQCGKKQGENSRFCSNCGAKFG